MDPERVRWLDYWRAPRADPPAEESGAVTRPVEAAAGSRGVRSFFVRASCVAVALTAACAGRTSSVATPPGGPAVASASTPTIRRGDARLGTWVWRKETVMNAKERQRLLDFAKEKGITELYVAIADEYEASEGLAALAELVRGARQLDIEIVWVCGDPSWALSARHVRALAVVERANRINALLRNLALPEIRSLQYDIEPYRLPEWKASPAIVEPQYGALLVELRMATQAAGFELWLDVPFWLGQRTVQGTSLGRLAVGASDGLVIMAYRNTVAGIVEKATDLLRDSDAKTRSVVVAMETGCREEPVTTLCGISATALEAARVEIRKRLGSFDAFAGLAVHPYEGWRDLSP
jgi:hypothetical protein